MRDDSPFVVCTFCGNGELLLGFRIVELRKIIHSNVLMNPSKR